MVQKQYVNGLRVAAVLVTLASIYIFAPWEAGLQYVRPLAASIQEEMDSAARLRLDGAIVYVQQADKPAEFYASGWHNRDKGVPAYPQALFKIASIDKLYTAAVLAKLAASGQLSLDETLAAYMPALKGRVQHADKITLRMMAGHRSGIPNFTDAEGFNWAHEAYTPDALLGMILDQPADFAPGAGYSYSNTNYLLLGMIMSEVLGYDYRHYIKAELLAPLDLTQTYFSVKDVDPDALMSGYYVGYDADLKPLDQGFVATAEDVGAFVKALNTGTLLSAAEQDIYTSIYVLGHEGWVLGYSSVAYYHEDIDAVVVLFVNTNGDDTVLLTGVVYDRIVDIIRRQTGRAP